jgi:poly(ADP-ribose) glycohydrolase ARH3
MSERRKEIRRRARELRSRSAPARRRDEARPLRDAARGALLGAFVGDALGAPYEGCAPGAVEPPLRMVEARLGAGTYTDDTQMTIALAESLLRCGVVEPEDLRSSFLRAHDPRRGYGAGTELVFRLWREGVVDAARQVFEGGSYDNGAAMRVSPVGVRFAFDDVLVESQAELSARLTHAHPVGVDGAVVQASAVAAAIRGESPLAAQTSARTPEFRQAMTLAGEVVRGGTIDSAYLQELFGGGVAARDSVPIAICIATACADFEEGMELALACGGDTDTIASMIGAIAGARLGAGAIPERWVGALEEGEKGRGHVIALADRLAERAERPDVVSRLPG